MVYGSTEMITEIVLCHYLMVDSIKQTNRRRLETFRIYSKLIGKHAHVFKSGEMRRAKDKTITVRMGVRTSVQIVSKGTR